MNKSLLKTVLKGIPEWDFNNTKVIRQVGNGPSNQSWLIQHKNSRYIARIDKNFAKAYLLDRENEAAIQTLCAQNRLAPELIYSDLRKGIFLSEYIEGRTWTTSDLQNKKQLSLLAKRILDLHSLSESIENIPEYNLSKWVNQYAKKLSQKQADQWAQEIHALLTQVSERPKVLCHNDLHPQNIIESIGKGQTQLRFIDFEYAGLGNPLFDVTTVLTHESMTEELSEFFLAEYFGEVDAITRKDLALFAQISERLLALWNAILRLNAIENNS